MEIAPVVASVVGSVSDTHWGQVLHLPNAYGVVEISAPDAAARVRGVTVLSRLTAALSRGPVSLKDVSAIADELVAPDVATLAILVPVGRVVYIVLRGKGGVYIRRGDKFATLMANEGGISGEVRPGDTILLASAGFVAGLPPEEIAAVFDHLTPQEVAEKLTLRLHERNDGEGGAAVIFEAAGFVSPDEPVSPPKPSVRLRLPDVRPMIVSLLRRVKHSKRFALSIALIAFFLLSVILGIRKQAGNVSAQKADAVIAQAQHSFDEGMALLDLNAVKGRERLGEARDVLAPLVSTMSDRSPEGKRVHDLYATVMESIARAAHISRVTPSLFFDVSVVKKDARASALGYADGLLGILDVAGRTVFDLAVPTKNGQIAGGGDAYTDASAIAVYGDRLYTLTPNGVQMARLSDRKTITNVVRKDDGWGTVVSLVAYGGNLYLLDSAKGRIWKYVATETGFSERREYLNPDTLPDLSAATGMAIDGSVWVGMSDGRIMRFTQGKEQTFLVGGMDVPLGADIRIFTDDAQKYLYVLDGTNKRVVALDKDGIYMAQYVWETDLAPSAFAVSEEHNLIFLLSGGTIYSAALE